MKEKNLKIKLSDGHFLYGKFYGSFDKPLFIVLHGLTGNMDEELYSSAVYWFQRRKYSTFRFNFYGFEKNARQLMDCSLKIHSNDLDTVINYFRKKGVKTIFVVGHSFAGPIIFSSCKQNFNATVLWDPTYKISFTKSSSGFPCGKYVKEINGYIMPWGANVIISKTMAEEIDAFPWTTITKHFTAPLKIIIAGKGELKDAKKYLNALKTKKSCVTIKNATHYFNDSPKMRNNLFEFTNSWFAKF